MVGVSVITKIWAFFCVLIAISLGRNILLSSILTMLAFVQLAVGKNFRIMLSYSVFYILLGMLLYIIRYHGLHMVIFSEFYVLMFWSLSPIVIVSWDLITTFPGEISAFLSKIHTPKPVILGLLVVFRFFPTMKAELKSVQLSMKNRGLTNIVHIVKHPIKTCEYVLIPFLFRVLMIADQLSVSAVVRGAEAAGIRGSYYGKKVGAYDLTLMVLWLVFTIIYLVAGGTKI